MTDADRRQLVLRAVAAREQAYAPYSKFLVGAALLTESGQIITGCNVENASFGMTICAERNAVFAAVAQGQRRFQAIAIATVGGAMPCGACRQVLAEFSADLPVLIVDVDHSDHMVETSLAVLLPGRFQL